MGEETTVYVWKAETDGVYNPFGYCGEYLDEETGFIYLRNRYYDPSIGRFITEDPAQSGTNWYVYADNNPIMLFDPFGLAPTTKEAAYMADHIYKHNKDSSYADRQVKYDDGSLIGWRLINVWKGRQSLKMGIYIRESDDWENPSEYTIAFKGTTITNLSNLQNDVEAYLGSNSADMWDAMKFSKGFVEKVGGTEVTFVGHSKGGGEAIGAATYTHKNAITFNAANFKFRAYGLIESDRTGNIDNYYVDGEGLSALIKKSKIGTSYSLETQYWLLNRSVLGKEIKIPDPYKNHSMSAIKSALN